MQGGDVLCYRAKFLGTKLKERHLFAAKMGELIFDEYGISGQKNRSQRLGFDLRRIVPRHVAFSTVSLIKETFSQGNLLLQIFRYRCDCFFFTSQTAGQNSDEAKAPEDGWFQHSALL